MVKKIIKRVSNLLGIKQYYSSETSKIRHWVINYCVGLGCDIGFGGDKIVKQNCIGIDYKTPYANTGKDKVDISCDVMHERIPVNDNHFDYVYSSHLIEDFTDTKVALEEFIRVLKSNGSLILVFPDQQVYEETCSKTGQPINQHHVHKEMGLNFMLQKMNEIENIDYQILFKSNCEIDYNVVIVAKISKRTN